MARTGTMPFDLYFRRLPGSRLTTRLHVFTIATLIIKLQLGNPNTHSIDRISERGIMDGQRGKGGDENLPWEQL